MIIKKKPHAERNERRLKLPLRSKQYATRNIKHRYINNTARTHIFHNKIRKQDHKPLTYHQDMHRQ